MASGCGPRRRLKVALASSLANSTSGWLIRVIRIGSGMPSAIRRNSCSRSSSSTWAAFCAVMSLVSSTRPPLGSAFSRTRTQRPSAIRNSWSSDLAV